jgi:hypothetical protein
VNRYKDKIELLANELLEKESLDLLDIIKILGERPFALSDTIKDYMKEIETRKKEESEHKNIDENKKEEKDNDKNDKSDEFDKDKDLKGKDSDEKKKKGGNLPSPKSDQEREIQEAETIMKS